MPLATIDEGSKDLTLRELAAVISVDHPTICRWRKNNPDTFPKKNDPDAVRLWMHHNIKLRSKSKTPSTSPARFTLKPSPITAPAAPAVATPTPLVTPMPASTLDGALVSDLTSGNASSIVIARAVVQVAAKQLGQAFSTGLLSPKAIDDIKKALAELRQAEVDHLDLEERRRNLIQRDEVETLVGECVARLVRCHNALINSIATELSLWISDPAIASLSSDARAQKVRQYIESVSRSVRQMEADDVSKLIDESHKQHEESN